MTTPLLIGGATTSRVHTAVKIEPAYSSPVVHVADASRAVGVAGALLDRGGREAYAAAIARRVRHGPRASARAATTRERRLTLDGGAGEPPGRSTGRRRRRGRRSSACGRSTTTRSPSSSSASTGRRSSRPGSCAARTRRSSTTRASARRPATCTRDAQALLGRIVDERLLAASAVVGLLARERDARRRHRAVRPTRRARASSAASTRSASRWRSRTAARTCRSRTSSAPAGVADYIGAFAVTAGHGHRGARRRSSRRPTTTTPRSWPRRSRTASRRRSRSGCTSGSGASCGATRPTRRCRNDDLIAERYQGIRPAPGYPATPDHLAKTTLFELLDAEARAGIQLTESMAMLPAASVSGLYLWHPESALLRDRADGRDQLEDYARRAGMPVEEAERWLAPNLADDASRTPRDELVVPPPRRSNPSRAPRRRLAPPSPWCWRRSSSARAGPAAGTGRGGRPPGVSPQPRGRRDYVQQTNFVQCVGASVQMMLNIIEPGADRTARRQRRLQVLARAPGAARAGRLPAPRRLRLGLGGEPRHPSARGAYSRRARTTCGRRCGSRRRPSTTTGARSGCSSGAAATPG